ncbi:putative phage tail tape measure domain protein [Escherichia coli PA47]|nr:putative phage tail tape measure domain protein [Escherichia coli PA47]
MLLDTLAWILEKLGVLPDEAERARKKIEDAQRAAILQDKVALASGGHGENQSAEVCGK